MHPFFERRITIDGATQCWIWNGSVNQWGYGRTKTPLSKERAAHRLSFVLHNGQIGNGLLVLHKCDTPRCCNPQHLFLGTNTDNMRDMAAKGRHSGRRGETNNSAKLTRAGACDIRTAFAGGETVSSLSQRFGVSRRAIKLLLDGVTWN